MFLSFFFPSVTFLIVDINLCLYVGLLQFYVIFLFFFLLFFFLFSFLILIFLKPIIIFSTFIPLFAFPTVLFPLQLIFNVCLLYLCLFNFAYIFFLSFLSSQHTCWEKEMATHSSILAQRILWTEEPGGLLSIGLHLVGHDRRDLACMHALEKEMATRSSILAWRIPGTEKPDELPSMGSHRVGHD